MDNQLERTLFDIGWLVGIIDGEGCFALSKKRMSNGTHSYAPTIQITNTNLAIMEKAQRIIKDHGLSCYFYSRIPKMGRTYFRIEITGFKRIKRFIDQFGHLFECRKGQIGCLKEYVDLRLSKQSHSPLTSREHGIAERLSEMNASKVIPRDHTSSSEEILRRYGPNSEEISESMAEMTMPTA